jgi:hypothetical protein
MLLAPFRPAMLTRERRQPPAANHRPIQSAMLEQGLLQPAGAQTAAAPANSQEPTVLNGIDQGLSPGPAWMTSRAHHPALAHRSGGDERR